MLTTLMGSPAVVAPSDFLARSWGDAVRRSRGDRPQRWLADATGFDQSTISRIEAGKARFPPGMLLGLAVALDEQVDVLFHFPTGLVAAERHWRAHLRRVPAR
jgi:hypothetical protein